jgi:hypothetical protein
MPIQVSNTLPVTQGSVTVVVTGVFNLPYQVAVTTSAPGGWVTSIDVREKTSASFRVDFAVPAPVGASIDYFIVVAAPPVGEGELAGSLITNIRDEIPDPVYDAHGNPLPDQDGNLVRASTLYGWLDDGVRIMARAVGAIIEDWTAVAQTQRQPYYQLNPRFNTFSDGFSNQWPLDVVAVGAGDVIWPSAGQAVSQSLWAYIFRRAASLQVGLWPIPALTDPLTTLAAPLGTGPVAQVDVTSAANFLSYGYIQIDDEILHYQLVSGNTLTVIERGQCGTTPQSHLLGAAVQHLGLWLKGTRSPLKILNSMSPVELPLDIISEVKTYVLARVRGMENEFEERARLMKIFDAKCAELRADPTRKENMGRVVAYGSQRMGPIAWPAGGGVVLP